MSVSLCILCYLIKLWCDSAFEPITSETKKFEEIKYDFVLFCADTATTATDDKLIKQ